MKVSLRWLEALVDRPLEPDALAARLTLSGLEIEARTPFAPISGVVVAKVVGKRPHPEAAKLQLVAVEDGQGRAEVVCGASNVPAPGGLVLWARPGARLPGDVLIGERPVRGIVSPGMLCAEDELGFGAGHEGLLLITGEDGLAVGDDVRERLGLPDEIWELNVPPNRPDWLGHLGVAREVAAAIGAALRRPPPARLRFGEGAVAVELAEGAGCLRYTALLVDGVTVGPSPLAMRLRLTALGMRPISNVVDVTNWLQLLYGQPLHAFDRDRLDGGGVAVRRARPGETLLALDGQRLTLGAEDLVIADRAGAVALAGIIGGKGSEVTPATTRLLIESACFDPGRVRRSAKRLGLHTEASHRFERGTDPSLPAEVAAEAAALLVRMAGGEVASRLTDLYPAPVEPAEVPLRPGRCQQLLGIAIAPAEQSRLLGRLGVTTASKGELLVATVPTFRADLTREIDLIEEVGRLYGYDHVVPRLPRLEVAPGAMRAEAEVRNDAVRDLLRALGLDEVVTYGFVGPTVLRLFSSPEADWVRLRNPLREEQSVMRTLLAPGLCQVLARNLAQKEGDVRLFEVGGVFQPHRGSGGATPVDERWHVAGLLAGDSDGWLRPGAAIDFYDLKGVVEELLAGLGHGASCTAGARLPWLHPNLQAVVSVAGAPIGHLGELHPSLAAALELPRPPYLFELDLAALPPPAMVRAGELPRFPAVSRDLSLFIDEAVPAMTLLDAAERLRDPLCVEARVLEEYRGDKRPTGKKGLLLSFIYRAADRTLTDEEVQERHDRLASRLAAELGFERR